VAEKIRSICVETHNLIEPSKSALTLAAAGSSSLTAVKTRVYRQIMKQFRERYVLLAHVGRSQIRYVQKIGRTQRRQLDIGALLFLVLETGEGQEASGNPSKFKGVA
jgi:hypothetical protein